MPKLPRIPRHHANAPPKPQGVTSRNINRSSGSHKRPIQPGSTVRGKDAVTLEFEPESGVTGTLVLTQERLLALIKDLGRAHEQISQGEPPPQLWGQRIDSVFNARWHIQPEPLSGGSSISFYHSAFGAVGFVIPREQVVEIIGLLSNHLKREPPARGRRN